MVTSDAERFMFDDDNLGSDTVSRIRPDDKLIRRPAVEAIMDMATSTLYEDPELMRLKVVVTADDRHPHAVRWIEREVHELRARRVARSGARQRVKPTPPRRSRKAATTTHSET